MPLIECEDCGNQVSSRAAACPQCGGPITPAVVTPEPTAHVTVEQTNRQLKTHWLWAVLLCVAGAVIVMVSSGPLIPWGGLMLAVGLGWMVIIKVQTWWGHG